MIRCPHCGAEIATDQVVQQAELDADFQAFWGVYPRHDARADALKAFRQTAKMRPPLRDLLDALRSQHLEQREKAYRPLAASWLRGQRWLDEMNDPVPASAGTLCPHDPPCTQYLPCLHRQLAEQKAKDTRG